SLDGRDKPGHDEQFWGVEDERRLHDGQRTTRHALHRRHQRTPQTRRPTPRRRDRRYGVKRLVWFERHDSIVAAIQREKSLKKYKREWKINFERDNPDWTDLFPQFFVENGPLAHLQPPESHL
ncbi:MAG: hypothetical protein ACREE0_18545, partial [Phenylobacterium sp.]